MAQINSSLSHNKKKQFQSKRQQNKKYDDGEDEFDIIEEGTSKENPKSMSIDSNDVDSINPELSTSNSWSNASTAGAQVKASSGAQIDIDDDDTNEFQAMFMSNTTLTKNRPNYSSTPLVRSQQNKPSTARATTDFVSSHQIQKKTHRPLSTITIDHQSTMSKLNMVNLDTPTNSRISANSSSATQASIGNQSLPCINYTTNNSAILETFAEYRKLRRDLKSAEQLNESWKADYQILTRQMQKLQNNSFPRPNADGRVLLEQLLESLKSCEQDEDSRTSKELANDIGIPDATLLSCSNVDPQKTLLHLFNYLFPNNQDKELLINVANINVKHPDLLRNIMVWSRRCTSGCGYSMSMLKDAIGKSIRCARHKLKTEHTRLIARATIIPLETTHRGADDIEIMSQDDDEY